MKYTRSNTKKLLWYRVENPNHSLLRVPYCLSYLFPKTSSCAVTFMSFLSAVVSYPLNESQSLADVDSLLRYWD